MTVTETAPGADGYQGALEPGSLLTTADHKRLGLLTIAFAFGFLLVGGVTGMLLRAELADTGIQVLGRDFGRTFSMHATFSAVLFLPAAWMGLATYLVPLQIGAPRLALARLHAFSVWLFLAGGGLLVAGYVAGPPSGLGLTSPTPLPTPGAGAHDATDLWIVGLAAVTVALTLAAVDIVVTVLTMRVEGLTMRRAPLFTWGAVLTSTVTVLAAPVFLAGLLLLYLDEHFGGGLYSSSTRGVQGIWQHTAWLYGRPEIYLLLLPGLGAACDIVATHARKALPSATAARAALTVFAALSFGAWAGGTRAPDSIVAPTYSVLTALLALPVALLVLLWLGAFRPDGGQSPRPHISLGFVAGALVLLAVGAAAALLAAIKDVAGGTAWNTGYVHTVVFGAPTVLLLGALHHWAPKILRRRLSAAAGALELALVVGGFALAGVGSFALGYKHMPAHVKDYAGSDLRALNVVAAIGGALVVAGVLLFIIDALRALAGRGGAGEADPYGGATLEWAAPAPALPHNFDTIAPVLSDRPLLEPAAVGAGGSET